MDISKYRVKPNQQVKINQLLQWEKTGFSEEEVREKLVPQSVEQLRQLQLQLYAEEKKGILVVLQAIDAAGKDEIITFIFSHLMPQALKVTPIKAPTSEEKKHDFLWRVHKGLPERGQIAILNRSYYEDLLAPVLYGEESGIPLPAPVTGEAAEDPWLVRARQVNGFEQYLMESGFPVVKFFLYVSREEQKKRLLERMKDPQKNWEFSFSDMEDREKWDLYDEAFERMLNSTSTEFAPWYALPADNDWYTRYLAAEIMIAKLEEMDPKFPVLEGEEKEKLEKNIQKLEKEHS